MLFHIFCAILQYWCHNLPMCVSWDTQTHTLKWIMSTMVLLHWAVKGFLVIIAFLYCCHLNGFKTAHKAGQCVCVHACVCLPSSPRKIRSMIILFAWAHKFSDWGSLKNLIQIVLDKTTRMCMNIIYETFNIISVMFRALGCRCFPAWIEAVTFSINTLQ